MHGGINSMIFAETLDTGERKFSHLVLRAKIRTHTPIPWKISSSSSVFHTPIHIQIAIVAAIEEIDKLCLPLSAAMEEQIALAVRSHQCLTPACFRFLFE
ncbi:unnamed protein product [Cuscuta epithymum]|uniref:Uncharacterized protein n=1 Tax=Cuscuta epithymum TaxID=186058 RepID=A0AAV0DUG0_9ASTE|nr:unnamed protein product [Cuscuta epithymum]